jgi:hypothetical protein
MGVLPSSLRYLDHGEIELCLASVHKYLPWVRTVYLVTDKQTPSCISLYPQVKVIDHSQILDENCLQPTFNSNVVEAYLHRIPELSEYFLYANDDMFVGQPIKKLEWFRQTSPLVSLRPRVLTYPIQEFEWGIYNANKLAGEVTGRTSPPNPKILTSVLGGFGRGAMAQSHQISMCRKSMCGRMWDLFPNAMTQLVSSRIRKPDEHQIQVLLLAALVGIHMGAFTLHETFLDDMQQIYYDGQRDIEFAKWSQMILAQRPKLYCINGFKAGERMRYQRFKNIMLERVKDTR